MMVVASTSDLSTLDPISDTNGDDNSSANPAYGTSCPLETSSAWTNGTILAHEEYFYRGPNAGGNDTVQWTQMQFQFTTTGSATWLGFGALTNCVADWSSSSLNTGEFYTGGSNTQYGVASSTSFVKPPAEVHDDNQSPWEDQCKHGPGLSDITVTGPNSVSLTQ